MYAFGNLQNVGSVTLPSGLKRIGDRAFYLCSSLTSITIPKSVTSIGTSVFYYCSALAGITVAQGSTSYCGKDGVLFDKDCRTLIAYPPARPGTSYAIPSGVTGIADFAFYGSRALTGVSFPASVASIGRCAFGNSSLTSVTLPQGLTAISGETFDRCSDLTDVTIPPGVTSIGEYAFNYCTSLKTVTVPASVTQIDNNAFGECSSLTTVYYGGTAAQRSAMTIGSGNDAFTGATFVSFTPVKITKQPTSVTVAMGAAAKATVTAAGDGLSYLWYYNDGAGWIRSAQTTKTYSIEMTEARNGRRLYCKVTDKYANTAKSNTVTIKAQNTVKITSQPVSATAAMGATVSTTVTATGDGLTYLWYYNDGAGWIKSAQKTAAYSIQMTEARDGRRLYCKVTDQYGNSVNSSTVTISTPGVRITKQPVSVTVAMGATASTTVTATGEGLSYLWYYNDGSGWIKSAQTTKTYSIEMTSARNGRRLYCKVTDKSGNSVSSDTVTIKAQNTVKITKQPVSVTVAMGETASTTVTATGDGLTYLWYYNDGAGWTKSAQTTKTYSIEMTNARNGRKLYCKVSDKYGNSVSSSAVTIKATGPKITKQPTSVTVPRGAVASTSVTATGEGLSYLWYYNDGSGWIKSAQTTATYSIQMTTARDGRKLYCKITDKNGVSVNSNTVTIKAG